MTNEPIHGRLRIRTLLACGLYAFSWSACSGDQEIDPDLAQSNDASDGDTAESSGGNLGNASINDDLSATNQGGGNGNQVPKNQGNQAAFNDKGGNIGLNNAGSGGTANLNAPAAANAQAPANAVANTPVVSEPPLDQEPAPLAAVPEPGNSDAAQAAAVPAPAPLLRPDTPLSEAPLLKPDLVPALARLFWVGYDYLEKESMVRIEMVTRGSPKYHVF